MFKLANKIDLSDTRSARLLLLQGSPKAGTILLPAPATAPPLSLNDVPSAAVSAFHNC